MSTTPTPTVVETIQPFFNLPLLDFGEAHNRAAFGAAVRSVEEELRRAPLSATPVIGGERRPGGSGYTRYSPSDRSLMVGSVSFATIAQADEAVAGCRAAFPSWRSVPFHERAGLLNTLADLLTRERNRFSALLVHEVGNIKTVENTVDVSTLASGLYYYRVLTTDGKTAAGRFVKE